MVAAVTAAAATAGLATAAAAATLAATALALATAARAVASAALVLPHHLFRLHVRLLDPKVRPSRQHALPRSVVVALFIYPPSL